MKIVIENGDKFLCIKNLFTSKTKHKCFSVGVFYSAINTNVFINDLDIEHRVADPILIQEHFLFVEL